jgi:hypothetical protein
LIRSFDKAYLQSIRGDAQTHGKTSTYVPCSTKQEPRTKPKAMRNLKKLSIFIVTIALSNSLPQANAMELTVGGQAGALGLAEGNTDTGVGYGAFVQASAFDILSLQADFLASRVNHVSALGIAPDVVWNAVKSDEFRFGLLAGPGFYELGSDPWRFGLNGGAFAEVSFIPNLPIGLQARYHSVFGGRNNDLWSVFMTVGFRFGAGGGGNDW